MQTAWTASLAMSRKKHDREKASDRAGLGIKLEPRIKVKPKADTDWSREAVMKAARKVMAEHHDVLKALADR